MTGSVKHSDNDASITGSRCGAVAFCSRWAVVSCFECERPCCARHLRTVRLTMAMREVQVRVCPDCLRQYRADPEIAFLLKVDTPHLD